MKIEYDKIKDSYKSDAIFNFEHPLIESVLQSYIKRIDDYKIFYLFANYQDTLIKNMRCENQYNLLKNTESFINTLTTIS